VRSLARYRFSCELNQLQPLSVAALATFNSGGGNELRGSVERPQPVRALALLA
jgi:hypothetical protein